MLKNIIYINSLEMNIKIMLKKHILEFHLLNQFFDYYSLLYNNLINYFFLLFLIYENVKKCKKK